MTDIERDGLRAAAAKLLDADVSAVERVVGGGNNEIFRIETPRASFALKRYVVSHDDGRDRLGAEFAALSMLAGAGEVAVPKPVAVDVPQGLAAYEWITGSAVDVVSKNDIDQWLAFLGRLHAYRDLPDAASLPAAAEACVDAQLLRAQIITRFDALSAVSGGDPALGAFLEMRFKPVWRRLQSRLCYTQMLRQEFQTLSPSDCGRHNMLRDSNGRLIFLDFEYFGWDDPVKLVSDIVWHPGSALGERERQLVSSGSLRIFGHDPTFSDRLERLFPLFGIRWALIVLSEFIPARWERRRRAGELAHWADVKVNQLRKAISFIERAEHACV